RIAYVNQRNPAAVTAVSRETFVNARPVDRNLAHVEPRELSQAPVSHVPPVQPVKTSVLGAGAPARVRPPAAVENRRVIATRNPPPPRAPFEQQRSAPNVRAEAPRPNEPARPPAAANPPRLNEPARPPEPGNVPRPNPPSQAMRPPESSRPET